MSIFNQNIQEAAAQELVGPGSKFYKEIWGPSMGIYELYGSREYDGETLYLKTLANAAIIVCRNLRDYFELKNIKLLSKTTNIIFKSQEEFDINIDGGLLDFYKIKLLNNCELNVRQIRIERADNINNVTIHSQNCIINNTTKISNLTIDTQKLNICDSIDIIQQLLKYDLTYIGSSFAIKEPIDLVAMLGFNFISLPKSIIIQDKQKGIKYNAILNSEGKYTIIYK